MLVKEIIKQEKGFDVKGKFLVKNFTVTPFKGKPGNYISLLIQDQTGEIPCKIWNNVEKIEPVIENGSIIEIIGLLDFYNGNPQVIIENLRIDEELDQNHFLPKSNYDPKEMFDSLCEIMNTINDDDLKKIWLHFHDDSEFIKKFIMCPASKGSTHGAVIHGLLEHTLNILKLIDSISNLYKLNKDVLCLGAFLHDIGKVYVYQYDNIIDINDEGRLHAHSPVGYSKFFEEISKIEIEEKKKKEIIKHIGHLILSHHERFEWQTCVIPMTREAIVLAKLDALDAHLNYVETLFDRKSKKSSWTDFDRMTERFYYETKLNLSTEKRIRRRKNS